MLKGFISYSHKDSDLCAALKASLIGFEREGRASFWSDHAVDAGDAWYPTIMERLESADIAVLLLSREYYASEFVWKVELPRARQLWEAGKLTVVSVRLRDCYDPKADDYKWLREVQQVPRDGRVIDRGTRTKRDSAWAEVAREIDRTIEKVLQRREAGIESSGEVDAALADTMLAVTRALEVARQVNADLVGPLQKQQIIEVLGVAHAALTADTVAIRDELSAAYHRFRRLKFERQENERLYDHLAQVRAHLMDLIETARDAGYPARKDVGLPTPKLVAREKVAGQIAEVGRQLDELQARVERLEAEKRGASESAAMNAAIDGIVEDVGRQRELARGLMSEQLIDIAGIAAAVEGATRAVTRFVRRVAVGASATMTTLVSGLEAAAGALAAAGVALARALIDPSENLAKVNEVQSRSLDIGFQVRSGKDWIEQRRMPGDGVPFRDVGILNGRSFHGPEMVAVPAGEFMMGLPADEERWSGYKGYEEPQHPVRIGAPFAIGRFAVTRGEFRAFVESTGHKMPNEAWTYEKDGFFGEAEAKLRKGRSWLNPGFKQDDRHPVVCVSWEDCHAYLSWLNSVIAPRGKVIYRLPSEAEWEYLCRAGTKSTFWWGNSISTSEANYNGKHAYRSGAKGKFWQRTLRVDSFQPNPWGVYQVHGNAWEWCQDRWHRSYEGAPSDGSPWEIGESASRVLRGGSWLSSPQDLRAALRDDNSPVNRLFVIGFRVARSLNLSL